MDTTWRELMGDTHEAPQAIPIAQEPQRMHLLQQCNCLLEEVQRGLAAYLERKRLWVLLECGGGWL